MASSSDFVQPRWTPSDSPLMVALVALILTVAWTLLGLLLAAVAGQLDLFWLQWLKVQATPGLYAGLFLGGLALSDSLQNRVAPLTPQGRTPEEVIGRNRPLARRCVILSVAIVGTGTTASLGFPVEPPGLVFYWATCATVCCLAGLVTWHAVEINNIALNLPDLKIEVFSYSPGETLYLKKLAIYITLFGAAMTVGYFFALAGTLLVDWEGPPRFVAAVQLFWPFVYVPLCLWLLLHPQLAIHRLIRKEKDRLIHQYQLQVNDILQSAETISRSDTEQINAIVDIMERIERSPNLAINLPILLTTTATTMVNLGSLLVPREVLAEFLRGQFLPC